MYSGLFQKEDMLITVIRVVVSSIFSLRAGELVRVVSPPLTPMKDAVLHLQRPVLLQLHSKHAIRPYGRMHTDLVSVPLGRNDYLHCYWLRMCYIRCFSHGLDLSQKQCMKAKWSHCHHTNPERYALFCFSI